MNDVALFSMQIGIHEKGLLKIRLLSIFFVPVNLPNSLTFCYFSHFNYFKGAQSMLSQIIHAKPDLAIRCPKQLSQQILVRFKRFMKIWSTFSAISIILLDVLENSQNSQENTCARVSFLIKSQALLKKRPSDLKQFLATESPLKIMENAFYLTLKTFFRCKDI